jgi:hypothetical protein
MVNTEKILIYVDPNYDDHEYEYLTIINNINLKKK